MKIYSRSLLLLGLLLALLLSIAPSSSAQVTPGPNSQTVTTSGTPMIFDNGLVTGPTAMYATFEEVIAGTPATVSIPIQGCMRGGTCETLDTYTTVANSNRAPTLTKAYDYFAVTPSWTGGTNVSVTVNYTRSRCP